MSDMPQGEGWWQASDGKWYAPEQAPGFQAPGVQGPMGGGGAAGNLDVGAALSYGWAKFTQYIGQIIVIVLIIFGVQIVFNIISQVIQGSVDSFVVGMALSGIFFAAGLFLSFLLQAGLIRAALAVTRGQAPDPSMLFSTENLGPFAVASLIVAALSWVGILACCIGMIVVLFYTYFYGFYVLDRGSAPVDSIKQSFELVKNNTGSVALLMIVVIIINFLTCGLASGVTFLSLGYAYKTLNGESVV